MNTVHNSVNLIGRTGINPVIRTFTNGVKLAKFSLATNETIFDPNGKTIKTQWHNLVAWGKKAELIEKYVKKGQMIAVEGKLINKVLTDLNGKKSKLTQIQVDEILLINQQLKHA
ncbi:single-stranded DNA-binding protein [Putridiphycobacter roseus]|uniref:Single-stranded DNA-binding protein n=1 Tax=Putridiphycobacter roseus TaxID=2219161 RepID=A0A2W1MY35_9FLAO|nr:single-stranded DNA-binding protein [Putridiphycobacter roseus]PZE16100.1 single-stranded DNA-binding protein [Putridiphycobacter roseus]